MSGDDGTGIGYKRPPKHTQFRPGRSGNPRGRPKAVASFRSDFTAEMRERVTVRDDNGRSHRISKQRALIQMLFSAALKNERSAVSAVLACLRHFGADDGEPAEPADLEDLDMLRAYLERAEARLKNSEDRKQSNEGKGGTKSST